MKKMELKKEKKILKEKNNIKIYNCPINENT